MQSVRLDDNRTLELINNLKGWHQLADIEITEVVDTQRMLAGCTMVRRELAERFKFDRCTFYAPAAIGAVTG
jgi:hypothetical protein